MAVARARLLGAAPRLFGAKYHTDKFSGILRSVANTQSPEFKVLYKFKALKQLGKQRENAAARNIFTREG